MKLKKIPRESFFDVVRGLVQDGYRYIYKQCRHRQSPAFQTRFLFLRAICITGRDAAHIFYDPEKFQRAGAVPRRVQRTLVGKGSVQTLDGDAHRYRKALFMHIMKPESVCQLMQHMDKEWAKATLRWAGQDSVVLFQEVQEMLCRAACAWAGVPLRDDDEARRRAQDFTAMVDGFAAFGPRHRRGRKARRRAEAWAGALIQRLRDIRVMGDAASTPAQAIAYHYCEHDGVYLATRVAAVELINILRPIVAIATYITFAALALHEHPQCRERLASGDARYAGWCVQEVRRFYPFGPFTGARVRQAFVWNAYRFPKGALVLLDIWGTNRDASVWKAPDTFLPERFADWSGGPFDFIPQGGGAHHNGHRCAGERITIEAVKLALRWLVTRLDYEVPAQDFGYPMNKIPTLPRSGFRMAHIRVLDEGIKE